MKRVSHNVYAPDTANGTYAVKATLAGKRYHKGGFKAHEEATQHASYLASLTNVERRAFMGKHGAEKLRHRAGSSHVDTHIYVMSSGKFSVRYKEYVSGITYIASGITSLELAETARDRILTVVSKGESKTNED